jgi:hypothetical protein
VRIDGAAVSRLAGDLSVLAFAALHLGWLVFGHGEDGVRGDFSALGAAGLDRVAEHLDLAAHG